MTDLTQQQLVAGEVQALVSALNKALVSAYDAGITVHLRAYDTSLGAVEVTASYDVITSITPMTVDDDDA